MNKEKDMINIILKNMLNIGQKYHLIIHGGNDYRIPISEGISAFTFLQLKNSFKTFIFL